MFHDIEFEQFSYWNANEWARRMTAANEQNDTQSVFLNPGRKERLSEHAKRVLFADVLYGGYLEDRSFLWKGSYMEPSKFLHLGVDFTGPAGTCICSDQSMKLIQVYQDPPGDDHGWGTRLMFSLDHYPGFHLVYGHLRDLGPAIYSTLPRHNLYRPGQMLGYLGTPEQNGGWSSHLHVQAIRGSVDEFLEHPDRLDGYGELDDIAYLAARYPDPMRFLKLG